MHIDQLNHFALHVSDLEKSIQFYQEILCLKQIDRPAFDFPGAWFQLGPGQELHLIASDAESAEAIPNQGHTALRVQDIAQAGAHLKAKGVEFRGPKPRPDGIPQIFLRDPDGHVIELTQL